MRVILDAWADNSPAIGRREREGNDPVNTIESEFWSLPADEVMGPLDARREGLTSEAASKRLGVYGANVFERKKEHTDLDILLSQFKSPLVLILVFAACLSIFVHDKGAAAVILLIVATSGLLGFWQERGASRTVAMLLAMVRVTVTALRDGVETEIPSEEVVPGDVLRFSAGSSIPADCLLLESNTLFVDEATLTGETYPVDKRPGVVAADAPLSGRSNVLFMGTHVISGSATAIAVGTGQRTEFGRILTRVQLKAPETEFQRGVRRFGYFLMEVTLVLVVIIFAVNVYLARPIIDAFLFALALAIGLTPQLLPAIISINLAKGAREMAREKVVVKRLPSIENFGSMNVLCSDKTGTLTEGVVRIHAHVGIDGEENEKVLRYAYINASFESGYLNPIDEAIRRYREFDLGGHSKLGELPYDFVRKRLSVLVSAPDGMMIVTKGAMRSILDVCDTAETSSGKIVSIAEVVPRLRRQYEALGRDGLRTLGVAYKRCEERPSVVASDESGMTFLGSLVLEDPPKPGAAEAIGVLREIGIRMKIISGDNRLVTRHLASSVGLGGSPVLTGPEIRRMSDEALRARVNGVDVFAEIEPNQKESIILALRKTGNVVGYLGDGVNDVSALHAADVSLSVDTAADIAKDAADVVLLRKDLGVLARGVRAGRATFANTLKYVFMATSANFGNMFSMAGASTFLPFLPLLPTQVLLTNLMTDFPEMTIAADNVDPEMVDRPRRWDIGFIRRFMVTFGVLSSAFDYLTFGALLLIFHATVDEFRTAWFMESVVSACLIVLVVRSRRPFFQSRPGRSLQWATLLVVVVTVVLPFTPARGVFDFRPVPVTYLLLIGVIVSAYVTSCELTKRVFYRKAVPRSARGRGVV